MSKTQNTGVAFSWLVYSKNCRVILLFSEVQVVKTLASIFVLPKEIRLLM